MMTSLLTPKSRSHYQAKHEFQILLSFETVQP